MMSLYSKMKVIKQFLSYLYNHEMVYPTVFGCGKSSRRKEKINHSISYHVSKVQVMTLDASILGIIYGIHMVLLKAEQNPNRIEKIENAC